MKLVKFGLCLALFAAACLPAAAQSALRFNIPFDFVAGGKVMPAGQYKVAPAFENADIAWTMVGQTNGVMFLTNQLESSTTAHEVSLIFLRSGGRLSLVEIWSEGNSGRQVLRTKVKQTLIAQGAKYVEISAE